VQQQWVTAAIWFVVGSAISAAPLLIGLVEGTEVSIFWAGVLTPLVIAVIGAAILCSLQQWISAILFVGMCMTLSIGMAIAGQVFEALFAGTLPVGFSYTLMILVTLLGIEWLSRKLLRLA
jgi:hypothetical protein